MGPRGHLSRRAFGFGLAALTSINEAALAQMSFVGDPGEGAVLLNANENPLGPCPQALEAMNAVLRRGGRYLFGESLKLARLLADQEQLPLDHVQVYAGSSDPLHRIILANCSPTRSLTVADPGYEAAERAAIFVGAKTNKVPLDKNYAHDVDAMLAAAGPNAGVFYICNPNNPTGTLTPRPAIEKLVAAKPAGSLVLIDEAYIHFSGNPSCVDLIKAGKDVIVLRTFSKIYGMAGLRAGAAFGRPELLDRFRRFNTGFLPTPGMVGAAVSLEQKNLVAERRKIVQDLRDDISSWLTAHRHPFVPSVSNKFMVDVRRPARPVIEALAKRNVFVGRAWPIWPTHLRVTIGTRDEMEKFKTAFSAVLA